MEWDLSVIYPSFEDEKFTDDLASITPDIDQLNALLASDTPDLPLLETAVTSLSRLVDTFYKLASYTQLHLSADASHPQALLNYDKIMNLSIQLEMVNAAFIRKIGHMDNVDALIDQSLILTANAFYITSAKESYKHLPSEQVQPWLLQMSLSGGEAFAQLRDKLDATHTVSFRGEEIPLSAARAKADDPDAAVRKEAYEAEIASYSKIALPMSYCLNSIKAEGSTRAQARQFGSVLEMSLFDSRMSQAALDAMWTAIGEYLPVFRRYLRAKGKLLGHPNGLPFYDLFAPMGSDDKLYSLEEARQILHDAFDTFNPEMAAFIDNAFDARWIDLYPRKGKSGGAFCAGIHSLGISRILSNFAGHFSDISTLAHELGHAWHNHCMRDLPTLMTDYPMPLAETASIFNETMLIHQALQNASPDMAFALLESDLMNTTQVIVDIYSRYLFESNVIEIRKDHTMTVDELNAAMLDAQEASYGDGLDKNIRHPYMWACKSHYYSPTTHFYNFPYAFGLLFGKGVFAQYLQKGKAFIKDYDKLLSICGSDTIANVAASIGIDVSDVNFWRSSLEIIRANVTHFEKECAQRA